DAGARDHGERLRARRCGRWLNEGAQRGNELGGHYSIAVRPSRVRTELEYIGLAIRAESPLIRDTRCGTGVFRQGRKPFAQITQDALRLDGARLLWIEGIGLRASTAHQYGWAGGRAGRTGRAVAR